MAHARIRAIIRQFAQNGMKLLLEDPRNVRELLTIAEIGMLDQIDFERMTRLRTSFVLRDYRHVEADVVLHAPLRRSARAGERHAITIYVLIEHQSEPDATMAFRVLEYVVQIYKAQTREWARQHGTLKGLRLHPVLPVVFYTGRRHWERLGRLVDLIEMGEKFHPVIPALDPIFLNLSALEARKLEAAGGFGSVLRLVQGRRTRPAVFQELLRHVILSLETLPASERLRWLELLSYIHALVYHERKAREHAGLQQEIEASVQTEAHRQEVSAMAQTIADKFRSEGELRARRKILLTQLRERFGELPKETVALIKSSKRIEQLDTWLRRFAKATTLEEIGIGD